MTIGATKERRDELRARLEEITAALSGISERYTCRNIQTPLAERCSLAAERDVVKQELGVVHQSLHKTKKAEQAYKAAMFTAVLVRELNKRGMGDIVREAQRMSMDETLAITLY